MGRILDTYVWNHLAACSDGKEVTTYFNGRKGNVVSADKLPKELPAGKAILGDASDFDQKRKLEHPVGLWERDYRVVRFSSVARYKQDFKPSLKLETDRQTIALLDFSKPQEGQIKDLSGNGHHGVVHDGQWIELPGDPPVASDGAHIVRLKPGEYIDVHSPKNMQIAVINTVMGLEMWCRWKVGAKGMQVLGTSPTGERSPGAFSIKVIPDKTETRLQVTYLDQSLAEVTKAFPLPAPDGKWHRLALGCSSGFTTKVLWDAHDLGAIEHRMHVQSGKEAPKVLVVGDPNASGDDSQLEIRSFRISASNNIAWD
jgi:hypothetical protein